MKKILYTLIGVSLVVGASNIHAADKAKNMCIKAITAASGNSILFGKAQPIMCRKGELLAGKVSLRAGQGIFGTIREGILGYIACKGWTGSGDKFAGSTLEKNIFKFYKVKDEKGCDAAVLKFLETEKAKNSPAYQLAVKIIAARSGDIPQAWEDAVKEDEAPADETGETPPETPEPPAEQ